MVLPKLQTKVTKAGWNVAGYSI